ncbi:MAG: VCBS domain-containing protein, partial [Burkholderiales bacterium]
DDESDEESIDFTPDGRVFLTNNDVLEGGEGSDTLDGGSGDDFLAGDAGSDVLRGGADGPLNLTNHDTLDGGAGIDEMAGGTGNDTYFVDGTFFETDQIPVFDDCGDPVPGAMTRVWTTDTVFENAAEGYDIVHSSADFTLPEHVEELNLGWFTEALIARGNSGDNVINGNDRDNRLEGGAGADTLFGDAGDDVLNGGAGDDLLRGGAGNDVYNLAPGAGRDLVANDGGGFDVVHVLDDLTAGDITLSRHDDEVRIRLHGGRDLMILADWFGTADHVKRIEFCDGMFLDEAAIAAFANANVLAAADDFASVLEDSAPVATGNVLANDTDSQGGASLSVRNPGTYAGTHGMLDLAADGSYTYALDSDGVQQLAEGESLADTFSYDADDAILASASATLNVSIHGENDTPIIAAGGASGSVTEDTPVTVAVEGDSILLNGGFEDFSFDGWLLSGDIDFIGIDDFAQDGFAAGFFGAVSSETLLGQDVPTEDGAPYRVRFWLTGGDEFDADFSARWDGVALTSLENTFLPDYVEFKFDVIGGAGSSRLEFALRNGPDYWHLDNISVSALEMFETVSVTEIVTGALAFTDVDSSDTHTVTAQPQAGDYLGNFDAQLATDSTFGSIGTVDWTFTVENGTIQHLAEGQTLLQFYDVTVDDGHAGGTDTQIVTIAIHGRNDAPFAIPDEANVQEDVETVASGNVLGNDGDPDAGTVLSVINQGSHEGEFGTLALFADGSYTYTLDNDAAQFLRVGQFLVEAFEYEITDNAAINPLTA